jgi:hypothetical protein
MDAKNASAKSLSSRRNEFVWRGVIFMGLIVANNLTNNTRNSPVDKSIFPWRKSSPQIARTTLMEPFFGQAR